MPGVQEKILLDCYNVVFNLDPGQVGTSQLVAAPMELSPTLFTPART